MIAIAFGTLPQRKRVMMRKKSVVPECVTIETKHRKERGDDMLLALGATIPDLAFRTKRFTATVVVTYDPFPDEYYRHFKIGRSNRKRYEHFDAMVNVARAMPKKKEVMNSSTYLFTSARDYYRSKLRRKR
jgi:hypothetical protein